MNYKKSKNGLYVSSHLNGKRRGVLITGTYGSGKDDIGDYLVREHGFVKYGFGDAVRVVLAREGLPGDRDTAQRIGFEKREKYGKDYWIKRVTRPLLLPSTREKPFVVVGTRYGQDVFGTWEYLKTDEEHAPLIWVDADPADRYKWQKKRQRARGDKVMSRKEFDRIDMQDRGIGKVVWQESESVIPFARYKLWNGGSEEGFVEMYTGILREIGLIPSCYESC